MVKMLCLGVPKGSFRLKNKKTMRRAILMTGNEPILNAYEIYALIEALVRLGKSLHDSLSIAEIRRAGSQCLGL
jgi:hypothetical protein